MKQTGFSGTLLALFEHCHSFGPDAAGILNYDDWLAAQLGIADNILPIRKFAPHNRCAVITDSNMKFLAVDNEPLAWLAENAVTKLPSLSELITSRRMPISWNVSSKPDFEYKASGVATRFRKEGLKLAHIENAGIITSKPRHELTERFRRSLCLSNVFLFPSPRVFTLTFSELPSGVTIDPKRPEEDPYIRSLAKSWLEAKLRAPENQPDWISNLTPELQTISDWKEIMSAIRVEVTPKSRKISIPLAASPKSNVSPAIKSATLQCTPCHKNTKTSAVDIDTAVNMLKAWRLQFPNAVRLDCGLPPKSKRNGTKWLHFKVDGYLDGRDDFITSKTNQLIKGSLYNGIVNFHGDAKCEAIDKFIAAYDACEQYKEILIPSATFEFTPLRRGKTQKPKFALNGFSGIEGFYLYHD